jgi:small subunit ribosomal protein S9
MATKLTKKVTTKVKPVIKPKAPKAIAAKIKNFTQAVGRRKSATAKARVFEGKQEMIVNNKPISQYWNQATLSALYMRPFVVTDTVGKYTASVRVIGSGMNGQVGAFVHAVSRALAIINPEVFKPLLRKSGLLTRDSRMKESRKVGQAGKARKKKQSPKR